MFLELPANPGQLIGVTAAPLYADGSHIIFQIRPATAADLIGISAIQQASPEASQWDPRSYLEYACTVVEEAGEVVGFLVCRQSEAPYCHVWPAHFQRRLPVIPVPLAEPDPDLSLDLQPLLEDIYSLGRYGEQIDYARPLAPALEESDAVWVRDLLKKRPRSTRP